MAGNRPRPFRLTPQHIEEGWRALRTLEELRDQDAPLEYLDWLEVDLGGRALALGCLMDGLSAWQRGQTEEARRLLLRHGLLRELHWRTRLEPFLRGSGTIPTEALADNELALLGLLLVGLRQFERARALLRPVLARGDLAAAVEQGGFSGPVPFALAVLTEWLGQDAGPLRAQITSVPHARLAEVWSSADRAALSKAISPVADLRAKSLGDMDPEGFGSVVAVAHSLECLAVLQLRGLAGADWHPALNPVIELLSGLPDDQAPARDRPAAVALQAMVERRVAESDEEPPGGPEESSGARRPSPEAASAALRALGARSPRQPAFLPALLRLPAAVHTDARFDPRELLLGLRAAIAAAPDVRREVTLEVSSDGVEVRLRARDGDERRLGWRGPTDDADAIAFGLAEHLPPSIALLGVRPLWNDDATAHLVATRDRWGIVRAALADAFDEWFSPLSPRAKPAAGLRGNRKRGRFEVL